MVKNCHSKTKAFQIHYFKCFLEKYTKIKSNLDATTMTCVNILTSRLV